MTIPEYSPEALRAVLSRHGLTGVRAAGLTGVDGRTVRKWISARDVATHREMPAAAWRLLLLMTGEIAADAVWAQVSGSGRDR